MADRYPPHMDVLFAEVRAVISPFLDARSKAGDDNAGFVDAIAILGAHVAICFALIEPEDLRETTLTTWLDMLPRDVDQRVQQFREGRGRLQ